MKTHDLTLDEIVFENRNKDYGAYQMRKSYSKNLSKALFFTVLFFLSAITAPLIANYFKAPIDKTLGDKTVIVEVMKKPKIEEIKLPPALKPEKPKHVFAPVVSEIPIDDIELPDETAYKNEPVAPEGDGIFISDEPKKDEGPIKEPEIKQEVFIIVEEMPEFPGGDKARLQFFASTIVYPELAKQTGVQGKVIVQFIVNEDGSITDIKLLRSIGGGCDEEAIRVLKMMPKWKAGRQNNKAVKVSFNMPISFKLRD